MKKLVVFFATLFIMVIAVQKVNAQVEPSATATANATAKIITPIDISKITDLKFGNIIASGDAGTVVIDNNDGRTATGGAFFPSVPGEFSSAEFTVTGFSNSEYSITLPEDNAIELTGDGEPMPLTTFTHNASEQLTDGSETFKVGATLNVNADQAAGDYEATFDVIVNYN